MAKRWRWVGRPLKHAKVKGIPVPGTGTHRRRYSCEGCDQCRPMENRTARERRARREQDQADG